MKHFSLILALLLSSCDALDSNINTVRNGILEANDSLYVGEAIENWKMCKEVKWDEFVTDNNKNLVEARCVTQDSKTEQGYLLQFAMSKADIDKFNLDYSGFYIDGEGECDKDIPIVHEYLLYLIYNNETKFPKEAQVAFDYLSGQEITYWKNKCN